MPSLEKPCLLLPHGCERSTVYMCVPVEPELAKESPVLETLMEFEGLVEMPQGVSLDDFERWATIVTEDPSKLDLNQLGFALRVGDKLSAANTAKLAEALAAKLTATSFSLNSDSDPMLGTMLLLSRNMQQLVFRKMGQITTSSLFKWPPPLQQAYADSWVTPRHGSAGSSFEIMQYHPPPAVHNFLSLLSRTDPSLPGLASLSVHAPIATPAMASLLCLALLHHPSLARLHLPYLSCAATENACPPAAAVLRTLPLLTALTSLTLPAASLPHNPSAADIEAAAETVHDTAAALSALPQLAVFHLRSSATRPAKRQATTCKRRKIAGYLGPCAAAATAAPSLAPVVAALSTAPALTSLQLSLHSTSQSHPLPCRGLCGPFTSLKRLKYIFGEGKHDAASASGGDECSGLLHSGPLPALSSLQFTQPGAAATPASAKSAFSLIAVQPALESAAVSFTARSGKVSGRESGVLCQFFGGGKLSNISVHAAACLTADVLKQSLASAASLACGLSGCTLSVHVFDRAAESLMQQAEDVAPMLQPLAALTHLKGLRFGCVCADDTHENMAEDSLQGTEGPLAEAVWSVFTAAPLHSFMHLTYLHAQFAPSVMRVPVLAEQLSAMAQLRSLSLRNLEPACVGEFARCLSPLTELELLDVGVRPVTADLVRAFASLAAGMPRLDAGILVSCDSVSEAGCDVYAADDWVHGLLDLPSRGWYEFHCGNKLTAASEVAAVRKQLERRGAEVRCDCTFWGISFEGHVQWYLAPHDRAS